MRGCRPEADTRFTVHGSWERAEHDADGHGSFAAVERSVSDRLLASQQITAAALTVCRVGPTVIVALCSSPLAFHSHEGVISPPSQ